MISFLFSLSLSIEENIISSKSVAVDVPASEDYVAIFPLSNCFVIVDSINGFSTTAYDSQKNQLGIFSTTNKVMNFVEPNGKIIVKNTGSSSKFYFSVIVMSNFPLDSRCSSIEVHNAPTNSYEIQISEANTNKCLWISSSSDMTVDITSKISGITEIYTQSSYSAIKSISNAGTASIKTQNPFIVIKPTNGAGSVTVSTKGTQISGIETYNYYFVPSDNQGPITPSDPPTPKPTPTQEPSNPTPQPITSSTNPSSTTSSISPIKPTPSPNKPSESSSSGDSDQGEGETPDKKRDGVKVELIVALVIVTIITIVLAIVIIFVFMKFRTLIRIL
ncbi:hypothetical protein TVAG_146830 [Trichomonas vaginalis G3]|uniref:Uncharacterized protein n=1 Tax=Trichomonas vaginalis (strain ATCC PRA-98 / G3) TaxID=412133 RepID=A2DKY7_TRIV3|nr:hypothetical protein TVAGG3_0362040 [Trichomonas vaginalis G3]EAY18940.1 hypothetical protein TVAG_146830 [Trichomonas vaginalis G3]KAI5532006.1 hypothetical protein TVAGG3_0362040 [Trichomonas vaginalis G3]|eukprot:XP_001579926.1 hypothetical protein [Trichomonas vaginalis G3]